MFLLRGLVVQTRFTSLLFSERNPWLHSTCDKWVATPYNAVCAVILLKMVFWTLRCRRRVFAKLTNTWSCSSNSECWGTIKCSTSPDDFQTTMPRDHGLVQNDRGEPRWNETKIEDIVYLAVSLDSLLAWSYLTLALEKIDASHYSSDFWLSPCIYYIKKTSLCCINFVCEIPMNRDAKKIPHM
jgi:hypothetical protein